MIVRRAALVLVLALSSQAWAGPRIHLVHGPRAPALERDAAGELASQLQRLYDAEVSLVTSLPPAAENVILLGSAETNPAIPAASWPNLSDQGHLVRTIPLAGRPVLLIGGGTPAATFWAVSEHGYQLGIRTFSFGDLDPVSPPAFHIEGWNVTREPRLKVRGFTTLAPGPIGLTAWGLADQQKLLRQLAKLKFNHLVVHTEAWYPFLDWEYAGRRRSTGILYDPIPTDGDRIGRSVFGGRAAFGNADFEGHPSWAEQLQAGQALLNGLLKTAHELGFSTCLSVDPLQFPVEFAEAVPGLKPSRRGLESQADVPKAAVPEDPVPAGAPAILEAAKSQLRTWLATYPEFDSIELRLEALPEWQQDSATAWQELLARHKGDSTGQAENQPVPPDLSRSVLAFDMISRLVEGAADWTSKGSPAVHVPHLTQSQATRLDQLLHPRTRSVTAHSLLFASTSRTNVNSPLELGSGLSWFGGHLFPDVSLLAKKTDIESLAHWGWSGFQLRSSGLSDVAPCEVFLSRLAFDPAVTPRGFLEETVQPICGEGVAAPVELAFLAGERALAFSADSTADTGARAELKRLEQCAKLYTAATNEMYRANTRSRAGGRQFTLYFARRFEAALALSNARQLKAKLNLAGSDDEKFAAYESAIDHFQSAGTSLSAVARNPSDRALIAIINEELYRPVLARYEELANASGE